jgi:hypothetical protein
VRVKNVKDAAVRMSDLVHGGCRWPWAISVPVMVQSSTFQIQNHQKVIDERDLKVVQSLGFLVREAQNLTRKLDPLPYVSKTGLTSRAMMKDVMMMGTVFRVNYNHDLEVIVAE